MASAGLPRVLVDVGSALEASFGELNRLDGYAGDGDLGITMSQAAKGLKDVVGTENYDTTPELLLACGRAVARVAPSTTGTLVATGLLRAAKALQNGSSSGAGALELAFRAALEGVQARGKASVGDKTLVDGLVAVCTSLHESAALGQSVAQTLCCAAEAAETAAQATAEMVPKIGRASWVPDRAMGHADAGCTMLAIVLRAAACSVVVSSGASSAATGTVEGDRS